MVSVTSAGTAVWVGIVSGGVTAIAVMATLGVWVWRRLVKAVSIAVAEILKKVTPNGGDSEDIGDRVVRIERDQAEILKLLRNRAP